MCVCVESKEKEKGEKKKEMLGLPWSSRDPVGTAFRGDRCGQTAIKKREQEKRERYVIMRDENQLGAAETETKKNYTAVMMMIIVSMTKRYFLSFLFFLSL